MSLPNRSECRCGTAAEARRILDDPRPGFVSALAELVVHDGITCAGTPEWLDRFLAMVPDLDEAALHLLWELTVDPAVPASLGLKGLAVDAPLTDGPCGSPTDNARECRRVIGPAVAGLPFALDPVPRGVLATAVHAGIHERPDLIPWFASRLTTEPVAAAIGLRNAGFPNPPPAAAVQILAAEAVAPTLNLSPWIRHSEAVGTYGKLLLDWPTAHAEVVTAALSADDPDVRHQGVTEAGRGLRCWRTSGALLVPLLVAAARDAETDVAEQAVVELSQVPRAGAEVLLRASSRRARAYALRALARDGDERCLSLLLAELREPALIADVSESVQGMRRFADEIVAAVGDYLRSPVARVTAPRTRSVVRAVAGWPESSRLFPTSPSPAYSNAENSETGPVTEGHV